MNEVMQVRAASWTAMIKQRSDSGLTIKEWCAANGIQASVYYYRLNRLRKMALNACETPDPTKDHYPSGTFAQISVASAVQTSNAVIRIRRGDTVDGCEQRCTGSHPLFFERGDVLCALRSPVFRPSISNLLWKM